MFELQGLLFAQPECAKTPVELVRLWLHEAERVYRDKLTDEKDMETFDKLAKDVIKKSFEVFIVLLFTCCKKICTLRLKLISRFF